MSFSAGLGSLFGAFGAKITERDAIMQAQRRAAAYAERAASDADVLRWNGNGVMPVEEALSNRRWGYLEPFTERMCDGTTVKSYRILSWRTIPPRWTLGRRPAPWCPMLWSKTKRRWRLVNSKWQAIGDEA